MKNYKVYIPSYLKEQFDKLVKKTQNHIELSVECGKPFRKVFRHFLMDDDGSHFIKQSHEIIEANITIADLNRWELLAVYKEGNLMVQDYSKKLEIKVAGHGADYGKCDCCGKHTFKESYLIRNIDTDEELQVGCKCAETYGVYGLKWVESFMTELYKIYDCRAGDCTDREPDWNGGVDPYSFRSVEVSEVIKAAKALFDKNEGKWYSGHYEDGIYRPSQSKEELSCMIGKEAGCDDDYVQKVVDYIASLPSSLNEFDIDLRESLSGYYMNIQNCHFAFFAIKKYEESLLQANFKHYEIGQQLHIVGKIDFDKVCNGWYGPYHMVGIKLADGQTVIRSGAVPNNEGRVDGYSIVSSVCENKIYLGRITKHPKKGIEVIETI